MKSRILLIKGAVGLFKLLQSSLDSRESSVKLSVNSERRKVVTSSLKITSRRIRGDLVSACGSVYKGEGNSLVIGVFTVGEYYRRILAASSDLKRIVVAAKLSLVLLCEYLNVIFLVAEGRNYDLRASVSNRFGKECGNTGYLLSGKVGVIKSSGIVKLNLIVKHVLFLARL